MAQRYKEEITEEIPEVDAVLGTTSYGDIVKALNEAEAGHVFREFKDINALPEDSGRRVITTGGHFGCFFDIFNSLFCNRLCFYCIFFLSGGSYDLNYTLVELINRYRKRFFTGSVRYQRFCACNQPLLTGSCNQ